MTDWVTISALATAGGTLVLAIATFASVRSGSRAARVAERALQVSLRPTLMSSRLQDPAQKIRWVDEHWAELRGGGASVEVADGNLYLAMSLRNSGSGIAVIQGWHSVGEFRPDAPFAPVDAFRPQTRDLLIAPGDVGFWQAAIRDPADRDYAGLREAAEARRPFFIQLLYADHDGGQRSIGLFVLSPRGDSEWLCSMGRHRYLDRP
jgi:hypothetical protein